jgi:UDP-N-acetylglucosamine 2-epimerase (non-hydrolysing)
MSLKILHVVGARPNFMKAAPVIHALNAYPQIEQVLVHTGQHYDKNMSDIFFTELGLPQPDINLEVGSGSHAYQTAHIMLRFEEVVIDRKPDWLLIYGDVNSTIAAALVCAKLGVLVGHVEAGLRSSDRTMPEEINRLLTDQISDLLFTPSEDGNRNLEREGIPAEKIHLVGNVMIDTVARLLPEAEKRLPLAELGLDKSPYALVTLHRPSNVDHNESLVSILTCLINISQNLPIIFPVHPRTRSKLKELNIDLAQSQVFLVEPLGYLDFLRLQKTATVVITDSGGIQEETTYLGVPCLTLRENTERPITVKLGTNQIIGQDMGRLHEEVTKILRGEAKQGCIPPLWDGRTGERIAAILAK